MPFKRFSEPTKAKLLLAFDTVRRQNILAHYRYACCCTCACCQLEDRSDRLLAEKGRKVRGSVYTVQQNDGAVYFTPDVSIGEIAANAIKMVGLRYEWGGTADDAIMILDE